MPWSPKQMRLFRAAAHNPAFAEKVGIKQADASRMSKEGVKAAKGGWMKMKMNHPDTKHGLLDLPVANLKKYQGMKEGGDVESKKMVEREVKFFKEHAKP